MKARQYLDFLITFQSTLSQGERLGINGEQGDSTMISIHALARRATIEIYTGRE